MAKLVIQGGKPLNGSVAVSGSKNAALELLAASLLASKPCVISNLPEISDVAVMIELLRGVGAIVERVGATVRVDPRSIAYADPKPELVGKMRASIVLIAPYLARFGRIKMSFPGGDLIGKRPIDTHLDAFRQLGASIEQQGKYYILKCKKLRAAEIYLSEMSVTATGNLLMAASSIAGTTTIHVAASEPEITNLADFLGKLGARIKGAGSPHITVRGTQNLGGAATAVIPDRLEAGTLLMATMITRGKVTLKNVIPEHLANLLPKLEQIGARIKIKISEKSISLTTSPQLLATRIDTRPYPGFPTDLQSPIATLLTQARGRSVVFETMYEGRFNYVNALNAMGAKIRVLDPHNLVIEGPKKLFGRKLYTPHDTRVGGAFILAGLAAKGTTAIENLTPIDRAYDRIDQKLAQLGADIERVE